MTRERYESISLHDLREIAKSRGMRRISTLKKADLISAMLEKDAEEAKLLQQKKAQSRPGQSEAAVPADQPAQGMPAVSQAVPAQQQMEEQGKSRSAARSAVRHTESAQSEQSAQSVRAAQPAEQKMRETRKQVPSEQTAETVSPGGQTRQGQSSQPPLQAQRTRQGTQSSSFAGNGRRQAAGGRQRRDDRQGGQTGRPQRPQRANSGQGYGQQRQGIGAGRDNRESRREQRPVQSQNAQIMSGPQGAAAENSTNSTYNNTGNNTGAGTGAVQSTGTGSRPGGAAEYAASAGMVRDAGLEYSAPQDGREPEGVRTDGGNTQPVPQDGTPEGSAGRFSRYYQAGRPDMPVLHKDEINAELDSGQMANGILEVMQDGFGFIRCANYLPGENDIYVAPSQIRRFGLKTGDIIVGNIRVRTQGEKFSALLYVKSVNGFSPEEATRRYNFEDMTPIFPDERIRLERAGGSISMRIMDLMCPVGKGQRGMIVSPPKAGKTTLLKEVARSVKYNNPEIHLIVLLIDERPEEVTDIREAIEGPNAEVIYSTFDELPEHHKRVSEMVIERARRLVEHKKDVMILLDSITRLTRAYNITEPSSGRTLSGGLDPAALHMPKRFFGAARNMREGGSLTILATALIDTGSKMDDIVFEEFKGTGNMELVLDRRLSERRIFPAIDIVRSGTRRDDLLLTPDEQSATGTIRRAFNGLSSEQAVTQALDLFSRTRTNGEFVNMVRKIQWGLPSDRPPVIKTLGRNDGT